VGKTYDDLRRASQERAASSATQSEKTRIGVGLRIKGSISGNEDVDVDGCVEGPIRLGEGKLTIGTHGNLNGDVTAREATIQGTLKGNLQIRERLEIKSDGTAVGDVVTDRIHIEEGAYVRGSIEIGRKRFPQIERDRHSDDAPTN
jgi:cytoskeletal protein CcmA (bactofilin family)